MRHLALLRSFRCFLPALLSLAPLLCACSSSSDKGEGDASAVSFNELNAAGDEWIELYNGGKKSVDLSSYSLADTDKATGKPRTDKAMRFPPGTTLDAGGFQLVLLGKKNSTPGPYAAEACLPGVAAGCFYALFSVSQSRGEALHLLDPKNDEVSSVIYPADLMFTADSGNTACRLPDGSGDLTTCAATPGAPNAAP
jgi:hypothetical protein